MLKLIIMSLSLVMLALSPIAPYLPLKNLILRLIRRHYSTIWRAISLLHKVNSRLFATIWLLLMIVLVLSFPNSVLIFKGLILTNKLYKMLSLSIWQSCGRRGLTPPMILMFLFVAGLIISYPAITLTNRHFVIPLRIGLFLRIACCRAFQCVFSRIWSKKWQEEEGLVVVVVVVSIV